MSDDQRLRPHEHKPHRVYVLRDSSDAILYVGSTSDVKRRIANHRRDQPWASEIDPTRTVMTGEMPWEDALEVEEQCIAKYAPRHNVQQTNGSRYVAAGLRRYVATENRLIRAASTGDPAAVAALESWQAERLREAHQAMKSADLSRLSFLSRQAS